MKELGFTCLAVLATMLFSNMVWGPWVQILAAGTAELAAVKIWIWLGGLVAFGAMAAYLTWPPYEVQKNTSARCE
ncbi:hypothetical protein D3C85_1668370 [compost metagenome]